jgi:predicted membrane protein (TIGR00267 family)
MEGMAFGLADGIICSLGVVMGVAEATTNLPLIEQRSLIIASGILAGLANAFGNSIGFFMSQETERSVQIHEAKLGVKTRIHTKREVLMSGILSFSATLLALFALIFPFIFFDVSTSLVAAFTLGIALSFFLGGYVGKLGRGNPFKTGLKYVILAVIGALVSHTIGSLLNTLLPFQAL